MRFTFVLKSSAADGRSLLRLIPEQGQVTSNSWERRARLTPYCATASDAPFIGKHSLPSECVQAAASVRNSDKNVQCEI